MEQEIVKTFVDHRGVAYVKLNRPRVHNAFDEWMIQKITEVFIELDKDPHLRMVVLSGEGESFCGGADLHWMKKMKDFNESQNREDSEKLFEMFHTLNRFSRPILGKVSGVALGGGAGLVSICDYACATQQTLFGFTEVTLGLVPAVISSFVYRKIGESAFRSLAFSGEKFSALKAQEINLIHDVVPDPMTLEETVDAKIKIFLKAGPDAVSTIKSLFFKMKETLSHPDSSLLKELTCETIARVRTSQEAQEGMVALLEKRKPLWVRQD
jgi:methylglutaconyl-CoA hydratase